MSEGVWDMKATRTVTVLAVALLAFIGFSTAGAAYQSYWETGSLLVGSPLSQDQVAGEDTCYTYYDTAVCKNWHTIDADAGSDIDLTVHYGSWEIDDTVVCAKDSDLDMYVYGPWGNLLVERSGCDSGTLATALDSVKSSGTYYVKVEANWGLNEDYLVDVTVR